MTVWLGLLSNQLLHQAVIFLYEFPEIRYTWRQQMTTVAKAGYRALAPDYRGYGLLDTPVKRDQIFFVDLVKDIGSILDHLNIFKINKKWREGFHVTFVATTGTRWGVVMSSNAGFSDQVVELILCIQARTYIEGGIMVTVSH
ncbi:putative epoxide hydrolase [Tanacetum coccineum]